MLADNDAELILVSGSETSRLFQNFTGTSLTKCDVDSYRCKPKYRGRFDCKEFAVRELHIGDRRVLRRITVFQIPHFSRGIYDTLKEGGAWLGSRVQGRQGKRG